jgi:DsbC/DsbD-like thiol-disulfide interchange protein
VHATWLVCKNICVPGAGDLDLTLTPGPAWTAPETAGFFSAVRQRLPVKNTEWKVTAQYQGTAATQTTPAQLTNLALQFISPKKWTAGGPQSVFFFPTEQNVLKGGGQKVAFSKTNNSFTIQAALEPNGDKPKQISGVLVSDTPLIGTAQAFAVGPIPIQNNVTK